MTKKILICCVLAQAIFAAPSPNTDALVGNNQQGNVPTRGYPLDMSQQAPGTLKIDKFTLDIGEHGNDFADTARRQKQNYNRIMQDTAGLEYFIGVNNRQLRDVDSIALHPQFLTTIRLPVDTEIVFVQASQDFKQINTTANMLILQPNANFLDGNIFISYKNKNKNFALNLIAKRYNKREGALVLNHSYFYDIGTNDVDILRIYERLNGDRALLALTQNGDYDTIMINNITYFIIRDDKLGKIEYGSTNEVRRYTISTKYTPQDKSLKSVNVSGKKKVTNLKKGQ